jgi:hypothetical protein
MKKAALTGSLFFCPCQKFRAAKQRPQKVQELMGCVGLIKPASQTCKLPDDYANSMARVPSKIKLD